MTSTNTLIIGAGSAGLACAALLRRVGIDFIMLERHAQIAQSWRNHYDRLHLHTTKKFSHLPLIPFADHIPTYPSRQDVVDYLENYAKQLGIEPQFNNEVRRVRREDGRWIVESSGGKFSAEHLIIATGDAHTPKPAQAPGLESFPGEIMHSSTYKNGQKFAGKNVLVLGFGNSGGEIAIDLHENGAQPSMAVRSAVNVIPRDILGISVLQLGLMMRLFPPHISDKINAPIIRFLVGDINKLGLKKSADGPLMQIKKTGRIPLLDIGTIRLIRQGHIQVFDGILRIEGTTVHFQNGKSKDFDAIVMATGYQHGLEKWVSVDPSVLEELKLPLAQRPSNGKDGLFFCGYYHTPSGMLREVGIEAGKIAEKIAASLQ